MGGSCLLNRLLTLPPQGVEHHQQTFKNDLYSHCNIQMRRNHWTSVLAYYPLFIMFLVNPLMKSSSARWFSQRITQPSSIHTSDFFTKRWGTVTFIFVFNMDFVVTILILSPLSNMEVGIGERSWLRTVFIIMSLDWFDPIALASRWDSCHAHYCSKLCYLSLHCHGQHQLG